MESIGDASGNLDMYKQQVCTLCCEIRFTGIVSDS